MKSQRKNDKCTMGEILQLQLSKNSLIKIIFCFISEKKFEQNISQERNQHNTHLATGGRIKLNHHQPHGASFKLTSN